MDSWLSSILVCPRDHQSLRLSGSELSCDAGHRYPVVRGVPVMLVGGVRQTQWVAEKSLEKAGASGAADATEDEFQLDTLGVSPEEREGIRRELGKPGPVDPVVRYIVAHTGGYLYKHCVGTLESYPIPELRFPPGGGSLLDVGCNWGRWSVAAARKGYRVVGVDPSLGAILSAQRVCAQLKVDAQFVVADGRYLPFRPAAFDKVFSYGVLQHLSVEDAVAAMREMGRVAKDDGNVLVQMANALGIRSLYRLAQRGFRRAREFEVRYWPPGALRRAFEGAIGPTRVSVDGFFALNIQKSDLALLPWRYRVIVHVSEMMRGMSRVLPFMKYFADSLYMESTPRSVARVAQPVAAT